jgi:hypothetical protein
VATLEQLLDAHQLAHARSSGSSADIIAGQILPFAPEPPRSGQRYGDGRQWRLRHQWRVASFRRRGDGRNERGQFYQERQR